MRFSKDLVGAFWASTGPAASTGFYRIPVAKVNLTITPGSVVQRMAIPARKRAQRSTSGRSGATDYAEEPDFDRTLVIDDRTKLVAKKIDQVHTRIHSTRDDPAVDRQRHRHGTRAVGWRKR